MKTLITGGAGFLAGKLTRALLEEGHEVRLLVRNPRQEKELSGRAVTFALGDLNDPASLRRG